MSHVTAAPNVLAASAGELAAIGSTMRAANAAAAAPTAGVLAAGGDDVSAGIAALFGARAQAYQAISAQAALFHDRFVQILQEGAAAYAMAEAANALPLQKAQGVVSELAQDRTGGTGTGQSRGAGGFGGVGQAGGKGWDGGPIGNGQVGEQHGAGQLGSTDGNPGVAGAALSGSCSRVKELTWHSVPKALASVMWRDAGDNRGSSRSTVVVPTPVVCLCEVKRFDLLEERAGCS